jgi:hypothetical protein
MHNKYRKEKRNEKTTWPKSKEVCNERELAGRDMAQAVSRRPPPRRPGFDRGSVHVGFVVDRVAVEQVFPRVLWCSPVNFIPPVLHYLEK